MMLENRLNSLASGPFPAKVEDYIGGALGVDCSVREPQSSGGLPVFIANRYGFMRGRIADREVVFMILEDDSGPSPADLAKHWRLVADAFDDAIVIYAPPTISSHNRKRLIKHRVPFVVPGNQLYVPQLAIDLREYFPTPPNTDREYLSPAAQVVLLARSLGRIHEEDTPTKLSRRFDYSAMTMSRAFDDLAATELAKITKSGRERRIRFQKHGRDLFEAALPLLKSPVRTRRKFHKHGFQSPLKLAGESALSRYTMLNEPRQACYATTSATWSRIAQRFHLENETDETDADLIIETWSYDPETLSNGALVDPLSLYLSLQDRRDERVEMSTRELLELTPW